MLKSITVFCGSADDCPQKYLDDAYHVGAVIASQGRSLLYGSGSWGSMGYVARGAQSQGGHVTGINVRRFDDGSHPLAVDAYRVLPTMQERKVQLISQCEGAIAIPGGMGTLDEITELFVMAQLGDARCPFGLLNMHGYFDGFLLQLKRAYADGFLKAGDYARLMVAQEIETLLDMLDHYDAFYQARLAQLTQGG